MNVAPLMIDRFHGLFASVMSHDATDFWLKGGRGSTKSSFISLCIVLLVVSRPDANAVVVRRFSNTLRDSVYQQMLWAIDALGLNRWFRAKVSPMEIAYLPTGQRIVFRGMDDPLKMKGVKFERGYCAVQWFEELDQIESWEAASSALRSFRRGGDAFWTFYSYNPPRTLWSWVNAKAIEMEAREGCIVHHSTYLDVVDSGHADWLGRPFIEDAEYEAAEHPQHYRWEFLGEITGTGGSVFENLRETRIADSEIAAFDNPRNGIDWGWFPDPWRLVRCEWQPGCRRLVIYDERSATKSIPQESAEIVREALTFPDFDGADPSYHDQPVWCDDANPSDIAVYRRAGIAARPAGKGNLRKASYRWLAGLREIAIDPVRCPLTFREFALCEYAKDRDGNWIDDFPDGNDHSIDAVRYAMMRDIVRGR